MAGNKRVSRAENRRSLVIIRRRTVKDVLESEWLRCVSITQHR